MKEQILLKKQFILHIVYNMIAFSIIFIMFGIFVFGMVRNITFSAIDKQLKEAKDEFLQLNDKLETLYKMLHLDDIGILEDESAKLADYNISKRVDNPQIIIILRDKDGNILNENELGRIGQYLNTITFEHEKLDNVYSLKIGNKYNYRSFNFKMARSRYFKR